MVLNKTESIISNEDNKRNLEIQRALMGLDEEINQLQAKIFRMEEGNQKLMLQNELIQLETEYKSFQDQLRELNKFERKD